MDTPTSASPPAAAPAAAAAPPVSVKVPPIDWTELDAPASLSSEERMRRIGVLRQHVDSNIEVSDEQLRYALALVQEERSGRMMASGTSASGSRKNRSDLSSGNYVRPATVDDL